MSPSFQEPSCQADIQTNNHCFICFALRSPVQPASLSPTPVLHPESCRLFHCKYCGFNSCHVRKPPQYSNRLYNVNNPGCESTLVRQIHHVKPTEGSETQRTEDVPETKNKPIDSRISCVVGEIRACCPRKLLAYRFIDFGYQL